MEVGDWKIHCEQLTSECTVMGFRRMETSGKETKWLPVAVDLLLKNSTICNVRETIQDWVVDGIVD